jgi:hypothetical protein
MRPWEIVEQFGFDSYDDVEKWVTDFQEPRFNQDKDACLYTDGDSGLAIIKLSEVYNESGIDIELVDCMYCGFHFTELNYILLDLLDSANNWSGE